MTKGLIVVPCSFKNISVSAFTLKDFGCKNPLIVYTLLYILGFTLIACATPDTDAVAYVGRVLTGIAMGGSTPVGNSYYFYYLFKT